MSKAEILAELPKLRIEERREIFDRICELEETALLAGAPTADEKAMLARELDEYQRDPQAGLPWNEVKDRIHASARQNGPSSPVVTDSR